MSDPVLRIVKDKLDLLGFANVAKTKYRRSSEETVLTVEIQNSRFDRMKHFLNVEVEFTDDARVRHGLKDAFAAWTRVESVVQEKKSRYSDSLDASIQMDRDVREFCLSEMFADFERFATSCATFDGLVSIVAGGWGEFANISEEVKKRAGK